MSVKFMDYIPENEQARIRSGRSTFDCSPTLLEVIETNKIVKRKSATSGEIVFEVGTYQFNSAVDIKSNVILSSHDGGVSLNSQAILKFSKNSDGLRFHRADTIGRKLEKPSTTGASGSIVRGLQVCGGGGNDGSGILMRCRVQLEDVFIRRFGGHGIEIVATTKSAQPSRVGNANGWIIKNTTVNGCGKHGLFIEGADTNTGYSLRFSGVGNGGYGLYDSSFLGNTHVGAHVSNNGVGAYFSDGKNARSIFIGCYAETPQRSYIRHPAMVIGGLFGPMEGSGQRIASQNISPFSVMSQAKKYKDDEGREITTKIGWAGKPFTMVADGDHPTGWGFNWRETSKTWTFSYAGLNKYNVFHLTTKETGSDDSQTRLLREDGTPIGGGELILPKFLFRNSVKRYQLFDIADVMKRIQDLEDEVERLS